MLLEVDSLKKTYQTKTVVNQVSLKVNSGEIVGLLGPNGAGKTTTFYMIAGLITPSLGSVLLDKKDLTDLPMYKRARLGIGYLPQELSVFRKLSVADNILILWENTQIVPKKNWQNRLNEILKELKIDHLKNQKAISLSGGEKRRVEIARALALNPKFLMLDEPFAGIDPIAVNDIKTIIAYLKTKGLGILITDHNVKETLSITDRAYIISKGTVFLEGTATQIAENEKAREVYLGQNFSL